MVENITERPLLHAAVPQAMAMWVFPLPTPPYSTRFCILPTNSQDSTASLVTPSGMRMRDQS